jgi:hypothetical protein
MRALMQFIRDLIKALTAPGAPLPDGSCCLERHGRLK